MESKPRSGSASKNGGDLNFGGLLKLNVKQARNVSHGKHVIVAVFVFLIAPPILYYIYFGQGQELLAEYTWLTRVFLAWFTLCVIQLFNVIGKSKGKLGALVWDSSFVVISYGLDTYKTKEAAGKKDFPEWNDCIPLVVNKETVDYKIHISVYGKKLLNRNKLLCSAVLNLNDLIQVHKYQNGSRKSLHKSGLSELETFYKLNTNEGVRRDSLLESEEFKNYTRQSSFINAGGLLRKIEPGDVWIPLRQNQPKVNSDTDNKNERDDSDDSEDIPELEVEVSFVSADMLQGRFWHWILEQFDESSEKLFSKVELGAIFEAIGSNVTDDNLDEFFGDNETLHIDEVCSLLIQHANIWKLAKHNITERISKKSRTLSTGSISDNSSETGSMVEFSTCPICKNELPESQSEMILHLAVCTEGVAAGEKFVMNGLITEANASRGWLLRLSKYLADGRYSVGANTGNILVQNRNTGELIEEKIPSYIRMALRVLYQTALRKRLGNRTLNLFKHLTTKQGEKFNSEKSVAGIETFIRFYDIDMKDVAAKSLEEFKTFNEFFYRKLKPGARKVASADPCVAVSPADSRCVVYDNVRESQEFWIKGQNFSFSSMLGDEELAKKMQSIAIFRLAPQDYHRFHMPVDARVISHRTISGEYYTVNPMAVREAVDVFTENVRTVTILESPQFGTVAYVCVGAMMVGSVVLTAKEGEVVSRLDECGYFAFGGSTVIVLFERDAIEFDADLIENSRKSVETLVRVGNSIGSCKRL